MKFKTKLKYRSDERPPQAKFFNRICHNRKKKKNKILNKIEIQKPGMPAAGEIFLNSVCHSRIDIFNRKGVSNIPWRSVKTLGVLNLGVLIPLKLGDINSPG